jgi:hypothetical protein
MKSLFQVRHWFWLAAILLYSPAFAQTVEVTARFDTNQIPLFGSTTFRVFAQVIPSLRATSDRIFSWYIDVIDENIEVAAADFEAMTKTSSDNEPGASSTGNGEGSERTGIFDSFIGLPGAGVSQPVELLAIPVTARTVGTVRFRARHGTGVTALSEDFIIAPKGGGDFLSGGDYTIAIDELEILPPCQVSVALRRVDPQNLELSFNTCAGFTHTVEMRSTLGDQTAWQALPNAPHNSGVITLANPASPQYFRVRREFAAP